MRIDILVVEDDVNVGRALARSLRRYGDVHIAQTLAEAYALLPQLEGLGAAVVDWGLPDGTGEKLLQHFHEAAGPGVPCLVVTGLLEHDVVNSAQALGAEITIKPTSDENIDAFMQRVVSRTRTLDSALDDYVKSWGLTRRHREILLRAAGGVPRRDLATELKIAEATLKTHVRTMRKRTGAGSLAAMVQEVLVRALRRARSR
ncbi:MAG: response regulator [Polyangiaceae bacterium]